MNGEKNWESHSLIAKYKKNFLFMLFKEFYFILIADKFYLDSGDLNSKKSLK